MRGAQHRCDASCEACSAIPPCIQGNARITCEECNRHFRNAACFDNHKRLKISGKTVCEAKKRCRQCGAVEGENQTVSVQTVSRTRSLGMCYMSLLSDRDPRSDRVRFLFYDFETTQNTKCRHFFRACTKSGVHQTILRRVRGRRRCGLPKEAVSGHIPSAISFPRRLNPDCGPKGSWSSLTIPRPSISSSY